LSTIHITAAIGVESHVSWPGGQDSQAEPECHRRRYLRYEARDLGCRFLSAGPVPSHFYGRYPAGAVDASQSD
jgi:hypothetical protein